MRLTVITLAFITLGILSGAAAIRSQTDKIPLSSSILDNPLWGFQYDVNKVRYDTLSSSLYTLCAKKLYPGIPPIYILAHIEAGGYDFYAEKNFLKPGISDNGFGAILQISGKECHVLDLDWTLSGAPPAKGYSNTESNKDTFPGVGAERHCVFGECYYELRSAKEESILKQLVKDAIQRGIRAYGGGEIFRKKVCIAEVQSDLRDSRYVIVLHELESYCSAAPIPK